MSQHVEGVTKNQTLVTVPAKSVTTTPSPITAAPVLSDNGKGAHQGITVQADPGNGVAIVYVGDSTVTTSNGIALSAGASFTVPVFDPHSIWAVSSAGTITLRISYV